MRPEDAELVRQLEESIAARQKMPEVKARPREESEFKDWAGGAKRSKSMPPWHLLPWKAIRGVLTRFQIGMRYGLSNWKKALSVGAGMDKDAARAAWHVGEPGPGQGAEDNSALGFVRQFYAHGQEHIVNAFLLCDEPVGAVSEKGDDLLANVYAHAWNALTLLEYAIENEDMFREAFSQYPVDSPFHRRDLRKESLPQTGRSGRSSEFIAAVDPQAEADAKKARDFLVDTTVRLANKLGFTKLPRIGR